MKNETINKSKKLTKTLITIIVLFVITIGTSILIIKNINETHEQKITKLEIEKQKLISVVKLKSKVTDSLLNLIDSKDYLYYIIEKESSIKIPNYVEPKFVRYMYEKAIAKDIPIDIMFRLVDKESKFYSDVVSYVGAYGFMQLMPSTYDWYCKRLNIDKYPYTEEKNIYIGTYMLAELYEYWYKKIEKLNFTDNIEREAWEHTLASYNAGIGRVEYYGGMFHNKGVSDYITYITENFK